MQEHRRIFGYRPPATTQSSRQSHVVHSSCTSTRNMVTLPIQRKIIKNTFTKAFLCLSKVNQVCPPNAAERIKLSLAGLGEKMFRKNGNLANAHEQLLETFPSLVNGGGYEIMHTSDGNSNVPSPAMGYDVNFLSCIFRHFICYQKSWKLS